MEHKGAFSKACYVDFSGAISGLRRIKSCPQWLRITLPFLVERWRVESLSCVWFFSIVFNSNNPYAGVVHFGVLYSEPLQPLYPFIRFILKQTWEWLKKNEINYINIYIYTFNINSVFFYFFLYCTKFFNGPLVHRTQLGDHWGLALISVEVYSWHHNLFSLIYLSNRNVPVNILGQISLLNCLTKFVVVMLSQTVCISHFGEYCQTALQKELHQFPFQMMVYKSLCLQTSWKTRYQSLKFCPS